MALEESMTDNLEPTLLLVMWDQMGLETVIDVTEKQKSELFDTLITGESRFNQWLNRTVSYLTMRARANSQRHYELYSIRVDHSITAQDIRDQFETAPQCIVDLIRERGTVLWNGRIKQAQVIF
jgi:hypothetical protein